MPDCRDQCSCVEEAAGACERIENMLEIGLDEIIMASAQTIDFSLRSQQCHSHNHSSATEVKDYLLRIHNRLFEFIQRAVDSCCSDAIPTVKTLESAFKDAGGRHSLARLDRRFVATATQDVSRPPDEKGQTPKVVFVYVPSKMTLGEYELDMWQSKYLVLEVCCRILRNMASVLQKLEGQETAELGKVDTRVLGILFRLTRLIEMASSMT